MTRILNAKDAYLEGARLIEAGELCVFPTETVYGLGANAFDESAVAKIFEAKGRPGDNPLIVHISRIEQVKDIACNIPKVFYELADKFMPGPLTIILQKSAKIPYVVTAGGQTVGIRMPKNEWARALIDASKPLAAPSANRSKHISPTTAQHVYEDLNGRVELILDDGDCNVGIESTVLDLTCDTPTILRPGAITADMLLPILHEVLQNGKVIKIAKSPGMKYTHYAPIVETVMAEDIHHAIEEYDKQFSLGKNPVILALDGEVGNRNFISLGRSVEEYTKNIYSALHDAEKEYDFIIIEALHGDGLEASVMNRVEKAAGGRRV